MSKLSKDKKKNKTVSENSETVENNVVTTENAAPAVEGLNVESSSVEATENVPMADNAPEAVSEPSDDEKAKASEDTAAVAPGEKSTEAQSANIPPVAPDKKKYKKYDLIYFFELALKSMANNIGMAIASLFVLISCLVVLGSAFLLLININVNLDKLGELNQVVVYCEYDAEADEVSSVGEKLGALSNVTDVIHVSKDESLDNLVEEYYSYSSIISEIFENEENPLSDSYIVSYEENEFVGELVYSISAIEGVRKVNNRADIAIKLENLKNGVVFIFFGFFVLLFVTGFFIVVNTIKMSVHFRRYDITVMKYIGATKAFVLSPFILEGIIIGVVAASLASVVQYFVYLYVVNTTTPAFGNIVTLVEFSEYGWIIWPVFLIVGVLCGLLGSITSLHKNLNA